MEETGKAEDARHLYSQAWTEASGNSEKFIAAHFLARSSPNISDKLRWLEAALQLALKIADDTVVSAFPTLYSNMAKCYEELGDTDEAKRNFELTNSIQTSPSAAGPFYHGTKADLRVGDLLTAGGSSNYKAELKMNHIYFTGIINGAGLAAALAKGDQRERVYIVEPTGAFEHDPNVTNQKFPGNPTRSYRSQAPLRITGEVSDWAKQTTEELQRWREKLARNKGEIIN
jgi:rifampin ADP-ribosylating transferase